MFPLVHDAASAVEFVMLVTGIILGLSHLVRPAMWADVFVGFHAQGERGVVMRTFLFELWPAMLIVTFHQVWWGPASGSRSTAGPSSSR